MTALASPAERAPGPLIPALAIEQGESAAAAPEEPVLDIADIQGNILVGFNKDHQAFLFFQITEPAVAKAWLRALTSRIASTEELLAERRLFRALRDRRGQEPSGWSATWLNVAFTWEGIRKLTSLEEANRFPVGAPFRIGLPERARLLGDPQRATAEGHPNNWVVGAPGEKYPDILLIIASDGPAPLKEQVQRVKREITDLQGVSPSRASKKGLWLVYSQVGENPSGAMSGHEHFGFKDGVSQPGVRGRVSAAPRDFLTPRLIDPADARAARFAKPGQPLIWPGEFVLGYPEQRLQGDGPLETPPPNPAWTRNGSYVVFRRLRQDVWEFWKFARAQAARLAALPGFAGLTAERFAALMVGRWPSGAPISRLPAADDPELGKHPLANNHFGFEEASTPIPLAVDGTAVDNFPQAPRDRDGLRCPFAAHIRKVNPRDDDNDDGGARATLSRRMLRRGIPYGPALADPPNAPRDKVDRGLLFLCYQSSIEDQFEFLSRTWVNADKKPKTWNEQFPAGRDPVIGQANAADGDGRTRSFVLRGSDGTFARVEIPNDSVIPTGGGYFFAPSITALRDVLST